MIRSIVVVTLFGIALAVSSSARAATCRMVGRVSLDPLDSYYCDTEVMGTADCSGWLEKDLDEGHGSGTAKSLKYMRVVIETTGSGFLNDGFTDSSGNYDISWIQGACAGDVQVRFHFSRVHESDKGIPYPQTRRYRFRLVDDNSVTQADLDTDIALTGSMTTYDRKYTSSPNPGTYRKLANIYYTANSAITEIRNWSTNLDSQFQDTDFGDGGIFQIRLLTTGGDGGTFSQSEWSINLNNADAYNDGALIRHEIGHAVHFALHDRKKRFADHASACYSLNFQGAGGWITLSCEWADAAMVEGIATYMAVRSITVEDKNAWWCRAWDDVDNLDVCSECANTIPSPDPDLGDDRVYDCATQTRAFVGIGDDFASNVGHCARVLDGCQAICTNSNGDSDCTDSGEIARCYTSSNNYCDDYQKLGWRNHTQVARFFWDMVDTNNEGGTHPDDNDMSMADIAAYLEGMTCTGSTSEYGDDNTCNEPAKEDGGSCTPSSSTAEPVTPMTSTRDSYNMYDLAWLIPDSPTSQSTERWLNCVQEAED